MKDNEIWRIIAQPRRTGGGSGGTGGTGGTIRSITSRSGSGGSGGRGGEPDETASGDSIDREGEKLRDGMRGDYNSGGEARG